MRPNRSKAVVTRYDVIFQRAHMKTEKVFLVFNLILVDFRSPYKTLVSGLVRTVRNVQLGKSTSRELVSDPTMSVTFQFMGHIQMHQHIQHYLKFQVLPDFCPHKSHWSRSGNRQQRPLMGHWISHHIVRLLFAYACLSCPPNPKHLVSSSSNWWTAKKFPHLFRYKIWPRAKLKVAMIFLQAAHRQIDPLHNWRSTPVAYIVFFGVLRVLIIVSETDTTYCGVAVESA